MIQEVTYPLPTAITSGGIPCSPPSIVFTRIPAAGGSLPAARRDTNIHFATMAVTGAPARNWHGHGPLLPRGARREEHFQLGIPYLLRARTPTRLDLWAVIIPLGSVEWKRRSIHRSLPHTA